ncbi:MAG: hypothetical protein GX354_12590 [Firmicutes bacterium]|jgi:hypothetical protein|nr:hypothetical protein [Bacillota bacterium]
MDRLANREYRNDGFKRAAIARFTPKNEYGSMDGRQDLAHISRGAMVRVDSFLTTTNTGNWQEIYAPVAVAGTYRLEEEPIDLPVLVRLREKYQLEGKLAGSGLDFERLVPLRTWIKSLWKHGLPFRQPYWNAEQIIYRAINAKEQFHCVHYSVAFLQCARSLGYHVRLVNLHRAVVEDCPPGREFEHKPKCSEHVVVEIWSNDLGKWIVFDVDYDCHYMAYGEYLNAKELHDAKISGATDSVQILGGPYTAEKMQDQTLEDRLGLYAHFSVYLRNNFLVDEESPVRIVHYVDESTSPILWWFGDDMIPRPDLMGPIHVAKPYKDYTPVLNDGRLDTAWASSDAVSEHWAQVEWAQAVDATDVVIHWADRGIAFRTSRRYDVEIKGPDGWKLVQEGTENGEKPWSHHTFPRQKILALKVRQLPGGGHFEYPNRLWLRQIQVF